MKLTKQIVLAALIAGAAGTAPVVLAAAPAAVAPSAAVTPVQLKAAHDLLAAVQAEKMMRMTAGASRYPDPASRNAVMDKLMKVPAESIYQRLSAPVAKLVSQDSVLELTKMYNSPYGQRLLHDTYNSGPSFGERVTQTSKAERTELARPALVKARKEWDAAQDALRHEMFVLLTEINRSK